MLQVKEIETDKLRPWEKNPRINDHAVDAVTKSIETFGFNVPIICDQNYTIIAGHTRWKAAKKLGLSIVPVTQIEMTEAMRKAFAIADNKTAEIADWDSPKLKKLLLELEKDDFDLKSLGFSDQEVKSIFNFCRHEKEFPEIGKETNIKTGDLYQLGSHRVICGDASDERIFQKLLMEVEVELVISSLPRFNNMGIGNWENIGKYLQDIEKAIHLIANKLAKGGIVHWNIGNPSNLKTNLAAKHAGYFESAGLQYLEMLILSRPYAPFSTNRSAQIRQNGYYYPAHQSNPIWVYQKPGKMPKMTSEGKKYMMDFTTDLWEINYVVNQIKTLGHPAVTPMDLPFRAIQAYSQKGAKILDPYAGTGTTLIAAEKAGGDRKVYLIEINPFFCEVTIDRWEKYTGQKVKRLE